MKTLLYNFYNGEQIAAAKEILSQTVAQLKLEAAQKTLRRRRDSREHPDVKVRNDIDDLIACITILDEHKSIDQLPSFVAADPDLIPSQHLCDKDMGAILNKLQFVVERVSAMQNDLDVTRALVARSSTTTRADVGEGMNKANMIRIPPAAGEGGDGSGTGGVSGLRAGSVAKNPSTRADRRTDTEVSSARETDDDSDFILKESRSARRTAKRLRASDSPQESSSAGAAASQPSFAVVAASKGNAQPSQQGKKKVVIGQSTTCAIKVSKNLNVPKAVYRIGNLDSSYTPELLKEYIESLGVRVLSCFDRTSDQSRYVDNKSFRVCIFDMDKSKLLSEANWSLGISISRWVFKPKKEGAVEVAQGGERTQGTRIEDGDGGEGSGLGGGSGATGNASMEVASA